MTEKKSQPAREKMKNPYDEYGAHPDETHLGHHWFAWGAVIVFVLLATVPPIWRNAYEIFQGEDGSVPMGKLFTGRAEGESLFGHLRETESEFETAKFTEPPRRALQGVLTSTLREGNRKTVIGKDGWLFFKPAIDGLTGYGPLKPEPDTVAKDPTREAWSGPLPAITRFGEQLEEMGVELVLVPIPVKPMIYPEMIGGRDGTEKALAHRDTAEFYQQLRDSGVQVLDLSSDWMAMKRAGTQVFLKQDTHWTPAAMQASAARVAEYLKAKPWFGGLAADGGFFDGEVRDISSEGDLVEKLDLPDGNTAFSDELAKAVTKVVDGSGNPVSIYDTTSPVVLLGDSFTNIFSDANMRWGADSGFAQHLSKQLGMTIDTIAQNGEASTGVRKTLATRPDAVSKMKKKKVVVWAIAARDLLLSETPAREALVEWNDVEFSEEKEEESSSPDPDAGGELRVRAKLLTKSSFANPQDVAYPNALYSCEYEIEEVLSGDLEAQTIWVFHWAFRERKLVPSSRHEEGDVREMTLAPFAKQTKLLSINQANDHFDVPGWWEVVEEVKKAAATEGSPQAGNPALRAGVVASIYGLVLSSVLIVVARRYGRRLISAAN